MSLSFVPTQTQTQTQNSNPNTKMSQPQPQPQPQPTLSFISTPIPTTTATNPLQEPQEPQQQQPRSPEPSPEDLQLEPSSPASSDLHATRPNRWRGHPSTWKTWTEADRQVWTALENARKADLAVHLYNAAGLRRGWRRGPDVDALGQVRSFVGFWVLLCFGDMTWGLWSGVGGVALLSFSLFPG